MKTLTTLSLAALLSAGTIIAFAQQGNDANDPLARLMRQRAEEEKQLGGQSSTPADASPAAPTVAAPASPDQTPPATTTTETTPVTTTTETPAVTVAAPIMEGGSTNGIRLNFRNAPLDTVLNYLSAAAGFHIVLDATPRGTVTVISSQPMTKDEAVDLLNSVLNKNGLAAIRNGQFLTIVSQSDRGRNFPVKVWDSNPASIPNDDEMVTQIIPVRFVEAQQLVRDLSSFVSSQATIVANEAGNSIVITDTQANIRHLAEIIKAIDSSAEGETVIRVFPLKFANPSDVATLLSSVFPSQNGGTQNPIRFGGAGGAGGGPGGFRGGGPGGGNPFAAFMAAQGGNANSTQSRVQKQSQVIAVADARTQSVVVTASKDLMDQIAEMMDKLDVPSSRDQEVYTVNVASGDPQQILQVLQNTFPANTTSRSSSSSTSSSQNSALQQRQQYNINQEGTSSSSSSSFGSSSGGGSSRGSVP